MSIYLYAADHLLVCLDNYKTCTQCGVFGEHSADKSRKDKLATQCKACRKKHYLENKQEIKKRSKVYYEENKERIKAYRVENKEQIKAYYRSNKKTITANHIRYETQRRKTDEAFRLMKICRRRVQHALKGVGSKTAPTMRLVGCTGEQLKAYLNANMHEELRDEPRENLHVDHIIPCAAFDLSREDHQRVCFHYTNLQYLHKDTNLTKCASLPPDFDFQSWFEKRVAEITVPTPNVREGGEAGTARAR